MKNSRADQMQQFLSKTDWKNGTVEALREDASSRRYFRVTQNGRPSVLMDAAPPFEEVASFAEKGEVFRGYGLSVPKIYARDDANGFLLLEDFGNTSFADAARHGAPRPELYQKSVGALIHLHQQPNAAAQKYLPQLDDGRLVYLVTWLIEWYIPFIQPQTLSRTIRERFIELWMDAFKIMRSVPMHAVHLDYQFHNLMALPDRAGIQSCGILDFQDAAFGPVTADLVMLLQDAREDVDPATVQSSLNSYLAAFPAIDKDAFHASYAIFAAHNAARILGLFARLKIRDGKGQYLKHIPRNLAYLEQSLQHPALAPIQEWFDTHVPRHLRLNIPGLAAA